MFCWGVEKRRKENNESLKRHFKKNICWMHEWIWLFYVNKEKHIRFNGAKQKKRILFFQRAEMKEVWERSAWNGFLMLVLKQGV